METFSKLPDLVQFILVVCAILSGLVIGVILLWRKLELNEILFDIEQSKDNTKRITELENNIETKIKERAIFELKNSEKIKGLEKQLEIEMVARQSAEDDKEKLQKTLNDTLSNLNERLNELEKTVSEQEESIHTLQSLLAEKNNEILNRDGLIAQLNKEKKNLEDTQTRIEAEKNGMLAMARELYLKLPAS